MTQPRNLAAAFAFAGLLLAGSIANAEVRVYLEAGATKADPSDVTAEFTTENDNASWGLSDMYGGNLQVGIDFGPVRIGGKARVFAGEVDTISGVNNLGIGSSGAGASEGQDRAPFDTVLGVGTINAYWDIYDITVADTGAGITPYIGVGVGTAHGFMRACGVLATEAAQIRCDHRNDRSRAYTISAGAVVSINKGVGLTVEYERIETNLSDLDLDTATVGLRISF